MFDGFQILSNTTKYDQTRSNTIKQHQPRCPNGKMFGHQTMFDGVWSPNMKLLSFVQALRASTRKRKNVDPYTRARACSYGGFLCLRQGRFQLEIRIIILALVLASAVTIKFYKRPVFKPLVLAADELIVVLGYSMIGMSIICS